jgi:hypothetical protein
MTFFPLGGGTDTEISTDPTELPPFVPGQKDNFPDGNVFLPQVELCAFNPLLTTNPNGPGSVALQLSLGSSTYGFADFGYVVLLQGAEENVDGYKAYPAQSFPAYNLLSITVPRKPTGLKVTILTKKSASIQLA